MQTHINTIVFNQFYYWTNERQILKGLEERRQCRIQPIKKSSHVKSATEKPKCFIQSGKKTGVIVV